MTWEAVPISSEYKVRFDDELQRRGQSVTLNYKGKDKCTCWLSGWPDPDCETCGGMGYINPLKSAESSKAIIQPATKAVVEKLLALDVGVTDFSELIGLFSTDEDLENIDYVIWKTKNYRVKNIWDSPPVEDEAIYQVCELERIDA